MSHDPLCFIASLDPTSYDYEERAYYECPCDLIARVREDESGKAAKYEAIVSTNDGYSDGYAAALRDAVEAVKALPVAYDERQNDAEIVGLPDAVAAIEALGDTPQRQAKEHINPTGYDPAATDNRP